ncbi:MAG: hypothetical protein AB7G21_09720 [Dehalococcoidia bacterium]
MSAAEFGTCAHEGCTAAAITIVNGTAPCGDHIDWAMKAAAAPLKALRRALDESARDGGGA